MKYSTFSLEKALFDQGYSTVAGMDEAGRGCLAGPVVGAVVVISSEEQYLPGVWDSKVMTRNKREELYDHIQDTVDGYGIGIAEAQEIDELGLSEAGSLCMRRAYEELSVRPDIVLVDGIRVRSPNLSKVKIKEGDRKHYVISAASVLAKVYRDRLMDELANRYEGYGFERNVGYGTREHMEALEKFGIVAIHRKTYSPIVKILKGKNDEKRKQ